MTPEALARVLKYVRHERDCPVIFTEELCTCGLTAALAALTPAPTHVHGFSSATNAPAQGEAWQTILDYAVNQKAAHHSDVCDCGLCIALAALARARGK